MVCITFYNLLVELQIKQFNYLTKCKCKADISTSRPEDYHRCHLRFLTECWHPMVQSPLCLPIAATLYAVSDLYDHSTSGCRQINRMMLILWCINVFSDHYIVYCILVYVLYSILPFIRPHNNGISTANSHCLSCM